MLIALLYGNWFGMIASLAFFALIVMLNFCSSVCNEDFCTKIIVAISRMSVLLCIVTYIEKYLHKDDILVYPCKAYCMNPNYLADILTVSFLASLYLLISKKQNVFLSAVIAVANIIAIYFTDSMSVVVALGVGILALLLLCKRYIIFGILTTGAIAAAVIFISAPETFVTMKFFSGAVESRFDIWKVVWQEFLSHPLFGKGFYTCFNSHLSFETLYHGTKHIWHSHNLFLECLVCFGVIGSSIALVGFAILFRRLGISHIKAKNHFGPSCFVIAIMLASVTRCMIDLTLFWTQTALLGAILIGGALGSNLKRISLNK